MGGERTGKEKVNGKKVGETRADLRGGARGPGPQDVKSRLSLHLCLWSAIQSCGLKLPQALNSMYHEVMMQKTFAVNEELAAIVTS